jgi:glycosyltransferase involved in cell wall biosynthesis
MLWSILICTIAERRALYEALVGKLAKQILGINAERDVELIRFLDNRELTTGAKRNELVEKARGMYISFVDDDDDVSDEYVRLLYQGAQQGKDCLSLEGIITVNGNNPQQFIHSLRYTNYTKWHDVYHRPPNHLNVIKKDLIAAFKFPEKNFGEDFDWSMEVCRAGVLKTEVLVEKPLYFYRALSRKK